MPYRHQDAFVGPLRTLKEARPGVTWVTAWMLGNITESAPNARHSYQTGAYHES